MTKHLSTNILEAYLPPTNIIEHFYLIGWGIENRNFTGQTSKQKRCFYFLTQAAATVDHTSGGTAGEGVWVQCKWGVQITPWEVTVTDLRSIFREDFCFAGQREKRRDIVQKLIVNWWWQWQCRSGIHLTHLRGWRARSPRLLGVTARWCSRFRATHAILGHMSCGRSRARGDFVGTWTLKRRRSLSKGLPKRNTVR